MGLLHTALDTCDSVGSGEGRAAHIAVLGATHYHCLCPQANCIDSTAEPTKVFAGEIKKLQADKLKPQEQITLEPYERDHAVVVGVYR